MIPDQLRIQPGQEALTSEQEAEVLRFADERIRAQLSTEPVDEAEAEAHLRQVYQVVGAPPPRVRWFDSPIAFVLACVPRAGEDNESWDQVWDRVKARDMGSDPLYDDHLDRNVWSSMEASALAAWLNDVGDSLVASVWDSLYESADWVRGRLPERWKERETDIVYESLHEHVYGSTLAYSLEASFVVYHFLHEASEPDDLVHLARFNELVSGYALKRAEAWLVRKPTHLHLDEQGRPHSASGMAVQYRDGWGFYAWHGVRVPERAILLPERLSREDFLTESNVEVRRILQERMGSRFVPEMGRQVIDTGPRGTLYEVALPADDPERVARYLQVQDASTERQYFLRVPPTIQTAAEAVAWTFQVGVEDYRPEQET